MCKILGAVGITDPKKINKIISNNQYALSLERDGFGYYSDKKHIQSLEYKFNKIEFSNFFLLHTRTATTGEISRLNAHTYQLNHYIFAHNGWCNLGWTAGKGTNQPSDSFLFFKKLVGKNNNITHKSLATLINSYNLYGIVSIIDIKKNTTTLASKSKAINLYTDRNKSGLVYSSFDINQAQDQIVTEAYGLEFDKIARTSELKTSLMNEIATFDNKTGELLDNSDIPAKPFVYPKSNWGGYNLYGATTPATRYTTKGRPVFNADDYDDMI